MHVAPQDLGKGLAELLERRRELRVVGVRVLGHEAGSQEDGHRLALRQPERRQERRALEAPAPVEGPDRHAELVVERPQVAIGIAPRHAEEAGQLVRRDPVRMRGQVGRDPVEARDPITLAPGQRVAPGQVPAVHAVSVVSQSAGSRRAAHPGWWRSGWR